MKKIILKVVYGILIIFAVLVVLVLLTPTNEKQTKHEEKTKATANVQQELTEEQKQKYEDAKKYVREKTNDIFTNITKEENGYNYEFFISSDVWNLVDYEKKKQIFELATMYVKMENQTLSDTECKVKTQIKDNMNGKVLAKYTLSGLKFE